MKGHVVFPAPSLKELEEDIKAELRTGWNPDAQEKVRVRTVLLSKSFQVLAVSGYTTLEYWHLGNKMVTMGAYSVDLGATYETVPQGKHYIYFDSTGIHATQTPWNLARKDVVFTGVVYWNSGSLYTGWHCHNWVYPADMRAAARPQITSGLGVTINSIEDHKIDVSDGILKFADIDADIRGNVTGHETFKQQLRVLEARRLWKVGGLWHDDLESELVAKLDESNNVQYCDPDTGLQSLVDGEYTAVWLVATFCNHRPVKIVLGSYKGATAEEAKTLNTPDSFVDLLFGDCAEVNHVITRIIIKDIALSPYYEIVEVDDTIRDDFDETPTFEQVQADWNEVDTNDPSYIKNKPSIPAAQIQSDWTQADTEAVDYIKNKPSIPAAQIQSDWTQTDTEALDYIKNKPSIPTNTDEKVKCDASDPSAGYLSEKIVAGTNVTIEEGTGANQSKLVISASGGGGGGDNVQSDWNQTDSMADDYIKNKPEIPDAVSTASSIAGNGFETAITLVNDLDSPGAGRYYGTNSSGNKGYHSLPTIPTYIISKSYQNSVSESYFEVSIGNPIYAQKYLFKIVEACGYSSVYGSFHVKATVFTINNTPDFIITEISNTNANVSLSITNNGTTNSLKIEFPGVSSLRFYYYMASIY